MMTSATSGTNLLSTAILLAGGKASRMGGGDKCLRLLAGQPLLSHVVKCLKPQVNDLVINANGDRSRFATFGLEVVQDNIDGQRGPLSGILAGLDWAVLHQPATEFILSVSTDCPFLPSDLVLRLMQALRADSQIVIAASNGRVHPVIGLWHVRLRKDLHSALMTENLSKVEAFCERHDAKFVDFPGTVQLPGGVADPFFNVNTMADLSLAEQLLKDVH